MRKLYTLSILTTILLITMAGCTSTPSDYTSAIPEDAAAVISVDIKQMFAKTGTGFTVSDLEKKILDQIDYDDNTGLDLEKKIYFFATVGNRCQGMVAAMKDREKFEKILQGVEVKTSPEGYSYFVKDNTSLVFDDNALVVTSSVWGADYREGAACLSRIGEKRKLSKPLEKFFAANDDINIYATSEILPLETMAVMRLGLSSDIDMSKINFLTSVNSVKGGLDIQIQNLTTDPKILEILKNQDKVMNKIDPVFLRNFPENPTIWMAAGFDGKKYMDFVMADDNLRNLFNHLSFIPVDLKSIISSIDGSVGVGFYASEKEIPMLMMCASTSNEHMADQLADGIRSLLSGGGSSYGYIERTASSQYKVSVGEDYYFGQRNGIFYFIFGDGDVEMSKVAGTQLDNSIYTSVWGKEVKGSKLYLTLSGVDLQNFMAPALENVKSELLPIFSRCNFEIKAESPTNFGARLIFPDSDKQFMELLMDVIKENGR